MVHRVIKELDVKDYFLGHLGLTDFVLITGPVKATNLQDRLLSRLEQSQDYSYPIKDCEKFGSHNRRLVGKIGVL
jgi:hypothetical protein